MWSVLVAGMAGLALGVPELQTRWIVDDDHWNSPACVAVDAAGGIHVAYMRQFDTDSNTKEIWYGNDRSGEFVFVNVTNNAVREEYPSLRVDATGYAHLAFHTAAPGTNKIAYTTNAGGADDFDFAPMLDVTGPGYIIVNHALGSDGSVHFVFTTQGSLGASDVYYRRLDGSGNLGALTPVATRAGVDEVDPDVAVGPDGVVHVVYNEGFFGGPLVYANDAGGAFAPVATGETRNVNYPLVEVDGQGRVNISYRDNAWDNLKLLAQEEPGGAFGEPIELTPRGTFRPTGRDRFAIDGSGRRYFAFAANVGVDASAWLIAETEDGFSEPILLYQESPGVIETGWSASVDVNAGVLAATYSFGRFDAAQDLSIARIGLATAAIEEPCPADWDDDGNVGVSDLIAFLGDFGAGAADFDGNGETGVTDLIGFLQAFGAGC